MIAPLYKKLRQYKKNNNYPFHMPGHKGGRLLSFADIFSIDITEIEGFDNLHNASGVIHEAQMNSAKLFKAKKTYFLVNGSTSGILAAVLAIGSDKDEILVARNCHRAVFSGLVLSGAKPVYILPNTMDNGLIGGVSVEVIKQTIKEHKTAKALIITSPTYEGFISDIKTIADIVHKNNMILIVDEAHGACFEFSESLPDTALVCGADIVIQSMHKTLPTLTQTALLHLGTNQVDIKRLEQSLSMVQTSSPSYVLMASMDYCCAWLEKEGKSYFKTYIENILWFRNKMENLSIFRLCGKELIGFSDIYDVDICKLVFVWDENIIDGANVLKYLREKWGIVLELCSINHFIAMTSPADDIEAFKLLKQAITELEKEIKSMKILPVKQFNSSRKKLILPKLKYTPREAYFLQKKNICLNDSCDMVVGETIIVYPPGIPLIMSGEIITHDIIKEIILLKEKGISLLGSNDKTLTKIEVIE